MGKLRCREDPGTKAAEHHFLEQDDRKPEIMQYQCDSIFGFSVDFFCVCGYNIGIKRIEPYMTVYIA